MKCDSKQITRWLHPKDKFVSRYGTITNHAFLIKEMSRVTKASGHKCEIVTASDGREALQYTDHEPIMFTRSELNSKTYKVKSKKSAKTQAAELPRKPQNHIKEIFMYERTLA
ncbi:MAG: hypothetical protein GY861_13040 [bacterium]|nr:hypothetical protein [bacterium]